MNQRKASLIVILAGMLFCAGALYAQAPAAAPAAGAAKAEEKGGSLTLWDRIKGGGWVMWPIGICSIATAYFIIDGAMRTMIKRVSPPPHEEALKGFFRQGDYVGAYNYCKSNSTPMTNVLRAGVSLLGEGKQIVEDGMIGELAKENSTMQSYISYLSVIGVCTPMIGLLGTVTGMMSAFATLGSSGIGDPSKLSSAIGEVLVATASGLFIAIPAFMAFYILRNRAAAAIHHIQEVINSLFRKMPYDSLAGVHIGDEELYAAVPNWVGQEGLSEMTAMPHEMAGTGGPSASQQISAATAQ
jgi:biopolymer transport protein ExbB